MTELAAFGRNEFPHGQLNYFEGSVLQALIRLWGPKRILELGTHEGVSTEYIAEILPPGVELVTVDKNDYEERDVEERYENVEFVHADSVEYLKQDNLFAFAFLDDDHEWESVQERLELLPEGSLAVTHDVIPPERFPETAANADFIINLPIDKRSGGFGVWFV